MSQSRLLSAVESAANVVVGFGVALLSQIVVFPLVGIHVSLGTNLQVGGWFTLISLVRSYILRRWFNGLKFRPAAAGVAVPVAAVWHQLAGTRSGNMGRLAHAVTNPGEPNAAAVCGIKPGSTSDGWLPALSDSTPKCAKCAAGVDLPDGGQRGN